MKHFYKIFISAFLAFLIVFQGVGFVHACQCMGMSVKKHHCCVKQQEQQKPPCPHHQKAKKQDALAEKLLTSHTCHCAMESQPQQAMEPTEAFPFNDQAILVNVIPTALVQEIDPTITQKPIWLRQLYYPDKVSYYIDTVRLLI